MCVVCEVSDVSGVRDVCGGMKELYNDVCIEMV